MENNNKNEKQIQIKKWMQIMYCGKNRNLKHQKIRIIKQKE